MGHSTMTRTRLLLPISLAALITTGCAVYTPMPVGYSGAVIIDQPPPVADYVSPYGPPLYPNGPAYYVPEFGLPSFNLNVGAGWWRRDGHSRHWR